ncbi:hypothetical protein RR47_GL000994 [Enterococcus columbae DSM 7374 = ATCC 51263]|nr:hypothetical protein RR47_GL000994 [Enterococcus columbae DSM 7374 = ATCC 51263]
MRAIVFDEAGFFYFVGVSRDDEFGKSDSIETSGGGVEQGESQMHALNRELKEELGIEVEIICKLAQVEDDYHLLKRHNVSHYYLCKMLSQGMRQLTEMERNHLQLSVIKCRYNEAVQFYGENTSTPFGRLVSNRELPVLKYAKQIIDEKHLL